MNEQILRVANYSSDTYEFIGISDGYKSDNVELLPFCTTVLPPKEKKGYVRVFNETNSKWEYLKDLRGEIAFDINTRTKIEILSLGELPDNLTLSEPQSDFDYWNGKEWVKDNNLEHQLLVTQAEERKKRELDFASLTIAVLQDSIELDMATSEDVNMLKEWKKYRVLLNRIETSKAPDILWPERPDNGMAK